ncbi:MAG: hypothetical protein V3R82_06845 [Candidatus Hydrothermarchaeales archaeon]
MAESKTKQIAMENEFKKATSQIFELRRAMQKIGDTKGGLINSIRKHNFDAERYKKARDRLNAQVKEKKKERTGVNQKIKEFFVEYNKIKGDVPRNDFRKLEREIEQLEWRQQTTVLKAEKEDELVKRLEDLKEQMKEFEEIAGISKKIDAAKAKSEKIHKKILELSEKSQEQHEKFVGAVNNIRALEGKMDVLNTERNELVSKLNGLTEIVNTFNATIKEREKKIKEREKKIKTARTTVRVKELKEVEADMKKKAEDVYDRFKNGKKLGTDDLYLLQRFNLV